MNEVGFSRSEFIRSLGYRNVERGLCRLDPWLNDGEGYQRIIREIAAALPLLADELQKAIAATRAMKAAEAEAEFREICKAEQGAFRPYIHVQGEATVPSGITLYGVTGGKWNLIEIPQAILDLPLDDQLTALPDLMRDYLKKYNGFCPFFGKVTGFRLVRCLDYFQFAKGGQFIEHVDRPFRRGHVEVSLR